jgi:hypothetical protein
MKSILFKALVVSPAAILALFPSVASANETINQIKEYGADVRQTSADQGQVTSVSQLKDVQPTDWAFQALQSLVERYGCIAGYPDGTFRGSRAMTRYEFAAGLNSCLDRVNELIASATADLVTKQDLAVLQKLQEEFQAELATLRGRVDALEATTAELKAKQFSTTTKLEGTAVFDLGAAGGQKINRNPVLDALGNPTFNPVTGKQIFANNDVDSQTTLGGWVALNLNTSFTGKDLLRTRLLAGNIQAYESRTGARESQIDYQEDTGNALTLDELYYSFPVGKARVFVGTKDLLANDIVPTTTNLQGDTVSSYFGDNPLSYDFKGGAGLGFNYQATKSVNLALAYLADDATAGKAGSDNGLTGGNSTLFGQLTFNVGKKFTGAVTYNHAYSAGNNSFGIDSSSIGLAGTLPVLVTPATGTPFVVGGAQTVDALGLNASYAFSPKFNVSGWTGFGRVNDKESAFKYEANLFNWAVNFGFPDMFREGNYGGISVGSAPYATQSKFKFAGGPTFKGEEDSPFMAQAFYRFKVSDNISIQPGIVYITNPNGNDKNDSVWVTSLRTKFSF